jgi:hypothetical protein
VTNVTGLSEPPVGRETRFLPDRVFGLPLLVRFPRFHQPRVERNVHVGEFNQVFPDGLRFAHPAPTEPSIHFVSELLDDGTPAPAGSMERIRSLLLHRRRPSPHYSWIGSCITFFEACSAFTQVTTCRLARSPYATLYTGGFGRFVTSTAAPIATGWSDPVPGRVFLPAVVQRLSRRTVTDVTPAVGICSLALPSSNRLSPERIPLRIEARRNATQRVERVQLAG